MAVFAKAVPGKKAPGKTKETAWPLPYDLPCGGLYWTRTNDPCDVNTVLYQLS